MGRNNNRLEYEGESRAKKPNRKVNAAGLGLYSLRHKIIAPNGSPMDLFQDALGERLGSQYNGKGFTVGSLGVTVAGISEYPDAIFKNRRPGDQGLTSKTICQLLLEDYGLGGTPLDLHTKGLDLFSKNPRARWKPLGIFFTNTSAAKIKEEQAAINDILESRGLPQLKKFGGTAARPHVSVGNIDTWTISDTEPATLEKIVSSRIPELLHFSELKEISPRQANEGPLPMPMPENDAFLTGPYIEDSRHSL